jgi:hypothetical protein
MHMEQHETRMREKYAREVVAQSAALYAALVEAGHPMAEAKDCHERLVPIAAAIVAGRLARGRL